MTHTIQQDFENLRHSNNNEYIIYNDIQPGDRVWIYGQLFEATEISGCRDERGRILIEFKGLAVTGYNNYKGTRFDGGRYGSISSERACIVKRCFKQHIKA